MHFVEVVPNSSSSNAPGWAYVPDTGYDPTKTKLQPAGRKRNARVAGLSGVDTTTRQNKAVEQRLKELDKENSKDVNIPVPSKQKEGGGRVVKGKTANTRKILGAQKTFAHYLTAEEGSVPQQESHNMPGPKSKPVAISRQPSIKATEHTTPVPEVVKTTRQTTSMSHAVHNGPAHLATDDSRLLDVNVPSAPSEALMEALVTAPPLSFEAARAQPSSSGRPVRHFCELCGYWGLVKCLHCGARVCGLACKKAHDEDRCQKYPG